MRGEAAPATLAVGRPIWQPMPIVDSGLDSLITLTPPLRRPIGDNPLSRLRKNASL